MTPEYPTGLLHALNHACLVNGFEHGFGAFPRFLRHLFGHN